MNPKILIVLSVCVLSAQSAAIHSRQKRTLGIAQAGLETAGTLASGALGIVGSGLATAAKVGSGLLVAKPILLGLAGKYALYRYLKNKAAGDGIHVGASAGVGADLPFLPEVNVGGSAGFGFGGADGYVDNGAVYDVAYDSSPIVYESTPVVYESAPVVYDNAPVIYESAPTYAANPSQFVADTPIVSYAPANDVIIAPAAPAPALDSYGAPAAPLLG